MTTQVYLVGLTGGIGSGKSTVAAELARLGAHVIDADTVAREVVGVGEPALAEIRERFGDDVIRDDGSLDRLALAGIVFADDDARADLNAITHPRIAQRIGARLASLATAPGSTDGGAPTIAVVDHPLLVETGQAEHYASVIVVTAPAETRVRRLAEGRGIDRDDARARIASQASDEARLAVATHVVDNRGDLDRLHEQVEAVWDDLRQRAELDADASA